MIVSSKPKSARTAQYVLLVFYMLFLAFPLLWLLSAWHTRRTQPEYAENRTLVERMIQIFVESIQGIAVTKAFGREAESHDFVMLDEWFATVVQETGVAGHSDLG